MPSVLAKRLKLNNNLPRRLPDMETDYELALQTSEGTRAALAQLVDRHIGPLYTYLLRRAGSGSEKLAGEVVQATFRHALRRMRPYVRGTATAPMRLWLIRLANRELARKRGKKRSKPSPPKPGETSLDTLRRVLPALSARDEAVLSLAIFEGMPAADIATSLGTSPARAMRILRHALRRVDAFLIAEEQARDG